MKDNIHSVYSHKSNGRQLFLNKKDFFTSFNVDDAKTFLKQIKESFWEVDKCRPRGAFYSALRYCFAEIDMLGKFYKGEVSTKNTAENSIAFMKRYMGSVNKRYKKLAGLIIDMYRHGLMHTHMTKMVHLKNGKLLGWELQDSDFINEHLKLKSANHGYNLVINVHQFIKDFLESLDKYEEDLKNKSNYLNKFKKGYFGMAVTFGEPNKGMSRRRRGRQTLIMKSYSYDSLQFLKREMQ